MRCGACLRRRIADPARRETMVAAIYGAVWYRLLLDEPLDEAFAIAARGAGPDGDGAPLR